MKQKGNSHYLYKDTTLWDREKKKKVRVSKHIGRIDEHGLVERKRRPINEFDISEFLLFVSEDFVTEQKRHFPNHWKEILEMSMVRAQEPGPMKYMKSE